jgi:hypothetical protein
MSDTDTLAAFLHLDDDAKAKARAKALRESGELTQLRGLPAPLRTPAADAIVWTAKALLRDPVSGVIGEAWGKLRDIQRFLNAPPDEVNTFTLQHHEIALARTPTVELTLNEAPSGIVLQFELKIALTLASAALRIQNRRIIGAEFGDLRGGGSFSLGRATIAERKTAPFRLPAKLNFRPGVAIG